MFSAKAGPAVTVGVKVIRKDGSKEDHGQFDMKRLDGDDVTREDIERLAAKFKGDN